MKKIAKIDPESEYLNAKSIIELARHGFLDGEKIHSLDESVEKIITATRLLMEREDIRRGKKPPKKEKNSSSDKPKNKEKKQSIKIPSVKYPHLEVQEDIIYPEMAPHCPCCNNIMKESGLFDVNEKLEVVPKRYYIQRNKRPKFNCGHCHGALVNTPAQPSIVPLSCYGDSMIIDVSLSKYCDLLPMERYAQMAARNGIEGLSPHSLIGLTHHLAEFLKGVYSKIKQEVLASRVLLADETPHKMLEGDETKNWYLWGFFCSYASYFEAHNSRSGDVAFEFLKMSSAGFLMTDRYGGYSKAIKDIKKEFNRDVVEVACNAHAFRYFKDASVTWGEECAPFLKNYGKIYDLEQENKKRREGNVDRKEMIPLFEELRTMAEGLQGKTMAQSALDKALNYFLKHYDALTLCLNFPELPLDNNYSERQLRAPVVGRKTWYGTHSPQGAKTMVIHFSIVSSCKANGINPRNYYPWVVEQMHKGGEVLTPYQYSLLVETQ